MKSIARTLRRLVLVFLMIAATSTMFLPSPAVAATSPVKFVDINPDNFETEVLKSDKPVLVVLFPELDSTEYETKLALITSAIQLRFSDNKQVYNTAEAEKYKFALGKSKDFVAKYVEITDKWAEDEEKGIHDNDKYYEEFLYGNDSYASIYPVIEGNYVYNQRDPITEIIYKNGDINRLVPIFPNAFPPQNNVGIITLGTAYNLN